MLIEILDTRVSGIDFCVFNNMESLILAQDERWRRA